MFIHQAITAKQERLIAQMNKLCRNKFNLKTPTPRYKAEASAYITENYSEFIQNQNLIKNLANGGVIM